MIIDLISHEEEDQSHLSLKEEESTKKIQVRSLMKKNQQQQQRAILGLCCFSNLNTERLGIWGCLTRMISGLIIINFVANQNENRSQPQPEIISTNIIKKKKKKDQKIDRTSNRSNPRGDSISTNIKKNNYALLLDEDFLISEILVRLPVKTLMRFKSVRKSWMSSIQDNPHFHQLHFNHSPLGLYIVQEKLDCEEDIEGHSEYFLSVKGTAATVHTFRERDELYYVDLLDPVNGLACLAGSRSVCIYNPSTREETQWIQTSLEPLSSNVFFGFDTVSKNHKVINHGLLPGRVHLFQERYACEVFTVGVDKSWRRTDDHWVPPYILHNPGYYVNGSIYWMEKKKKDNFGNDVPAILLTFDLGTEKFREIPIPYFIIDLPSKCHGWPVNLLELDGHVALVRRVMNKNIASIWRLTYEDEADHNRNCWTEVIITLPFYWEGIETGTRVGFDTIPGSTCQIIVRVTRHDINDVVRSIYICNWKINALTKIEFGELFSSPALEYCHPIPFTESLFRVNYI